MGSQSGYDSRIPDTETAHLTGVFPMITSLRLADFKNFADETLHLGPLTIIVGANASGKSNLRDAFRFLQGIGRGFTLSEIIDGRFGPGGLVLWSGIRGLGLELFRFGQDTFTLQISLDVDGIQAVYSIEVGKDPNSVGSLHIQTKTPHA